MGQFWQSQKVILKLSLLAEFMWV